MKRAKDEIDELIDSVLKKPKNEKPNGADGESLESFTAASIDMKGLRWFWPERFNLGKIGIVAGLPDKGKGLICCFMAAAATARREFPCNEGSAPQGNVIWFTAEDSASDTIGPRLIAAGADLTRIHFIKAMQRAGDDRRMFSLVSDLHRLRNKIEAVGNVVLVIFDPISAYLGIGKVDGRSAIDVRSVLSPLKEVAEETGALVLAIMHFNKKADVTSALLRISDSIAFTATARNVYAVVDDPEDDKLRLFVKVKNNLAPSGQKALQYGFGFNPCVSHDSGEDIGAPYVEWSPVGVDISANDALAANSGSAYARREAKDFLLDRLGSGPAQADDLIEEAKQNGISQRTLYRAKKELGVVSKRGKGDTPEWSWVLPAKQGCQPSSL